MDRYRNKYRIQSNRKRGWDYSSPGLYFITFVTQHRDRNLGIIKGGMMILSDFGEIVDDQWNQSFSIRDELLLHEYVIMPDHLHAIVEIVEQSVAENGRFPPAQSPKIDKKFYRKPKSISSFMAGFKSSVNTAIDDYIDEHHLDIPKYNRHNHFFQSNYHDRIIRNKSEYFRIKNYIINNPKKWNDDRNNPEQSL